MVKVSWAALFGVVLAGCGSDDGAVQDGGRDLQPPRREDTAALCGDLVDNDDDGFTDCADQDCWPLTFCEASRTDGWNPPGDGGARDGPRAGDGQPSDADGGARRCTIHHDCDQGWFCYKGRCLRDPKQTVYHCGEAGCPPGRWCITQAGARDRCAEDATYVCQDACDCGPAHCCIDVASLGGKRCVKDLSDPWIPGGALLDQAVRCAKSPEVDATYCSTDSSCYAGQVAYAASGRAPYFRAFNPTRGAARAVESGCGGETCFGSACNCASGQVCVDTLQEAPVPGRTCLALSGGSCVSTATAEAVFGWSPADLLPCCAAGCAPGRRCDLGWRSGGDYTYARVEGICGSCGNGVCEGWEYGHAGSCPADCTTPTGASALHCGDGRCDPDEHGQCDADCGCDGDHSCEPWERKSCADCATSIDRCEDTALFRGQRYRVCGDGWCQASQDCAEPETCKTCPQDCGACSWQTLRPPTPSWLYKTIHGLWGSSPTDVYAVGARTLHSDGSTWRVSDSTGAAAIWGSSRSDIFAVGGAGLVRHFDGTGWKPMAAGTAADLGGVWGSSASDVFAVGAAGTILHYDGAGWQQLSASTTATLAGVWGSSASNVFAVGTGGVVLRYDGKDWQAMPSGTTAWLTSVWGSSATDVWAVGRSGTILRFDGTTWAPGASNTTADLNGIWGSSATSVFAVGHQLDYSTTPPVFRGPILHYDGTIWTQLRAEPPSLHAVWGSSASDVFAVGGALLGGAVILHDDGSGWQKMTPTPASDLYGVWASATGELFAVGGGYLRGGAIVRRDGQGWSETNLVGPHAFEDVWGSSASDVFAVGVTDPGALQAPTWAHYDGQSWTPKIAGPSGGWLRSVWGSSPTSIFAVGGYGFITHYDGSSWQTMASNNTEDYLRGVWGNSASDVFAVGSGCNHLTSTPSCPISLLHYDGTTWQKTPSDTTGILLGVWGSAGDNVFAVGVGGMIQRFDGQQWQPMSSSTAADLRDVWGRSATSVFAVGSGAAGQPGGVVLRHDGTDWRQVLVDLRQAMQTTDGLAYTCPSLSSVAGTPAGEVFAVGQQGLVIGCQAGPCDEPTLPPSSP